MKKILVLNGPNLNLLGKREPEIYGYETLDDINNELKEIALKNNHVIEAIQSNSESEIVSILQKSFLENNYIAIIINAAAYTHTSIAILDSLKLFSVPIMEVHITDPMQREEFRHFSYISQVAKKIFKGEGKISYIKALKEILDTH